jgi:hypothetical protein
MDDITKARGVPCPVCKMGADQRCVDIAQAGPEGGGPAVDGVHQPRIYRAYLVGEAIAENLAYDLQVEIDELRGLLNGADYLVWSNQRGMWWRAGWSGYTQFIEEAGRYTLAAAEEIVRQATCDGALKHQRTNPITGVQYPSFDEVVVAAPKFPEIEVPF